MRFRVFILVIFIFLLQSVHGGVSEQLVTLLADCPASVAADYASTIPAITKKMRDQVATLKAVVPRACYLELGESQLETALVLGNYGLSQGLKPSTISDLTELLSWKPLPKGVYLNLARTYEKMLRAGAGAEEIAEIFYTAQNNSLGKEQTETLTLLYAELRSSGKSHREAMASAKKEVLEIKKLSGKSSADFIAEKSQLPRLRASAGGEPVSNDALWDQLENAIKTDAGRVPVIPGGKKPVWNADKLASFFEDWKGTPYKWGGVTKKGIDCSGFVLKAIESQFPQSKYPRSASQLAVKGMEVERTRLQPGDLVFFAASDVPGRITHVGIFLRGNEFAHASSKYGVTSAKISDKYYTKRFVTARRLF